MQSMPPGGPRMSPLHQMPQQTYAPMHNYQPPPPPHGAHGPYTPPYGSPQQVRKSLFNCIRFMPDLSLIFFSRDIYIYTAITLPNESKYDATTTAA
jgi:hypothetical protein